LLYTVQISSIKSLNTSQIEFIDITVKSSVDPWTAFAPTWEMVQRYKSGGNQEEFTEQYTKLMRQRFKQDSGPFFRVIKNAREGDIALACYCPAGEFCHRLLIKNILQKIDRQLIYGGELRVKSRQMSLFE
jgi:uncharacterized protein YeaO (DUF488 family)